MNNILKQLSDNWFLTEPAFFALYCQHELTENVRMDCAVRCGEGRIEYNPLMLKRKSYAEVEQLMRIELIRLFLKHPYERRPEGCGAEAIAIGSNITIADGYCVLHKEKLPLHDPTYYHLPLGMYYEWYAKEIQKSNEPEPNEPSEPSPDPSHQGRGVDGGADGKSGQSTDSGDSEATTPLPPREGSGEGLLSALWHDDSLRRQQINDLIERTTDWGTMPADIVERIKASTRSRIDQRLVWQGFQSAVLSSQRQLTRMRPNRRTGFLQMGSTRQFDTRLLVAVDVSGSITDTMLAEFFGSVNRLFRYGVVSIDLCQFDAALGPISPMDRARSQVIIHGRGGTNFQPLIDYLTEHPRGYDGVIVLTDGQAPLPSFSKLPPMLWVLPDRLAYDALHEQLRVLGRVTYLI